MAACKAGPEDLETEPVTEQRCLPLRRQHAGRLPSGSDADSSGVINDAPKRANSNVAEKRRTDHSLPKRGAMCTARPAELSISS